MARLTNKKPRARDLMEVITLLIVLFLGVCYEYELLIFISSVYAVVSCLGMLLGCFMATLEVVTMVPSGARQMNTALLRCQPEDWWQGVHTSLWCWCGIIFVQAHHPTIALFAIFHGVFLLGWWFWIVSYSNNRLRNKIK
ncbi:hypothetical protein PP187_gp306 [Klebsiella phage vB_KvM-Eowyn]|uniref:Transmembrane protein n=1 Tax=Klebsiella phage vB_KvM-Eowyn TaxID=2762819 RepID=A0A7R8R573_9CAUD|nr:hypothetical protein PP187_gp306 [Klebsiella phage vB_KvM-Eowyn]CAD5236295.1 hypothetical protein LLCLJKAH_00306 [Klebsiella phage vB_KvM-Eowyn]